MALLLFVHMVDSGWLLFAAGQTVTTILVDYTHTQGSFAYLDCFASRKLYF